MNYLEWNECLPLAHGGGRYYVVDLNIKSGFVMKRMSIWDQTLWLWSRRMYREWTSGSVC